MRTGSGKLVLPLNGYIVPANDAGDMRDAGDEKDAGYESDAGDTG